MFPSYPAHFTQAVPRFVQGSHGCLCPPLVGPGAISRKVSEGSGWQFFKLAALVFSERQLALTDSLGKGFQVRQSPANGHDGQAF